MLHVFLDKYFYDYKMSKFSTALDCSYGNKPTGKQESEQLWYPAPFSRNKSRLEIRKSKGLIM